MREFNSKLPKECIDRLNEYLVDEELKKCGGVIHSIYGYCRALCDIGILTLGERIEITDICTERYFKERYGK